MRARSSQKLLIRLSSLGDVVLATAALEAFRRRGERVDWLVSREFAPLLEGHPAVRRVWAFDRRAGLRAWWRLAQELGGQGYVDVYDLHGTLRATLLWVSLRVLGRGLRPGAPRPAWHRCEKPRLRLRGYLWFRALWPKSLRPVSVVRRMATSVGGSGEERPDLRHLLKEVGGGSQNAGRSTTAGSERIAVMPASKWAGKCWPTEKFVELFRLLPGRTAVVFGTESDALSRELVKALREAKLPVESGVGVWSLAEAARVLASCDLYLGNDTGLSHLAEALGVPAFVLFGPTTPEMGFGPWRKQSRAFGQDDLACRPCSKDGRVCVRFWDLRACLKRLDAAPVASAIQAQARVGAEERVQ